MAIALSPADLAGAQPIPAAPPPGVVPAMLARPTAGSVVLSPDDLAGAQAAPAPAARATEHQDKGAGNAFLEGVAQGASFGFYDELAGLAETNLNPGGAPFWKKYEIGRDRARAAYHDAAKDHPIASTLGQVAGGVVTAPVSLPVAGTGFAANAARGAAAGILSGAGGSEADTFKGVVQDAAKSGLVGGLVGGVTGTLAEKAVRGAEGRIDDRMIQDITGGRATAAGKKVYQNKDIVIAAAKKFGLDPDAANPAALAEAAETARQQIGQQLGDAYETIGHETLGARTKDITSAIKGVASEYNAPSEAPIRRQIATYLDDVLDRWGKGARDRVTLRDLNAEIGNLERVGFKGAELSDAAGAQLKRDLSSALEDVLQNRLEEVKGLGESISKTSLASREGFAGVADAASAAKTLPELNRDYRGLKLISKIAQQRAGLPAANQAAGGLRNAVGNAVDASLLFTHPGAFLAKKAGEKVAPVIARGADSLLGDLYSAAQAGKLTAQMLQQAIEAGVPRGIVERLSSAVVSGPAATPEQQ